MKNIDVLLRQRLLQVSINWWRGKLGPVDESFVEDVKPFSINSDDGLTCTVIHNDRKIRTFMIVGSHNLQNWLDDFNFALVKEMVKKLSDKKDDDNKLVIPYGNENSAIRMHRGFTSAYVRDIRDMARDFAKDAKNRGMDVAITGHSYGGALTAVTFIDWHYMFTHDLGVPADQMDFMTGYAAASPAVGNKEFVDSFVKRANGNYYSDYVLGDPVPQVPNGWEGYQQIPNKWYSDFVNTISLPFTQITNYGTLGFFPSWSVWNHHPLRLMYGLQGKALPPVNL